MGIRKRGPGRFREKPQCRPTFQHDFYPDQRVLMLSVKEASHSLDVSAGKMLYFFTVYHTIDWYLQTVFSVRLGTALISIGISLTENRQGPRLFFLLGSSMFILVETYRSNRWAGRRELGPTRGGLVRTLIVENAK
jgi:hypothetical protein